MGNLELLSTPSVTAKECERRVYQIDGTSTPKLQSALRRMHQGDALRRLQKLQAEVESNPAVESLKSDSQVRASGLRIGRRIPERRRSFASSA